MKNNLFRIISLSTIIIAIMTVYQINITKAEILNINCYQVPDGIIAWWKGEENTKDSINYYDGVIHGDVTYVTGKVGKAFNFLGDHDYIQVHSDGTLPAGSTPRTFEMWIYTTAASWGGDIHNVIMSGESGGHRAFGIDLEPHPVVQFFTWSDDMYYSTSLTETGWFHAAMTYDGLSTTLKGYINGSVLSRTLSGILETRIADIFIGSGELGLSQWYLGYIDEISIYNRELSPTEIQGIYNAGEYGKCYKYFQPLTIKY